MGVVVANLNPMAAPAMKIKFSLTVFLLISLVAVKSFKLTDDMKVNTKSLTPHWVQLCDQGHQYLFSEDEKNWTDAGVTCQLFGGYLVKIENRHENNCILYHAQSNPPEYGWWWTSGHKRTEGYFIFEDGTEMEWLSYWQGANPDGGEDGILINASLGGAAGSWADAPL